MVDRQVEPVKPGPHSHLNILNGNSLVQTPRLAHGFGIHGSLAIFRRQRGLYVPNGQVQSNDVPLTLTLHVPPFYQSINYLNIKTIILKY